MPYSAPIPNLQSLMSRRIILPADQVRQLPIDHQFIIPASYLDEMGHMNIRWYMALFNEGVGPFLQRIGLTDAYFAEKQGGVFALEQFLRYLAEVHVGEMVTVRGRLVARSAKRLHFMQFIVNETNNNVACIMEVLNSHADLHTRRTSPYPPHLQANIDALLAQHNQLDWAAPVSGMIHP